MIINIKSPDKSVCMFTIHINNLPLVALPIHEYKELTNIQKVQIEVLGHYENSTEIDKELHIPQ